MIIAAAFTYVHRKKLIERKFTIRKWIIKRFVNGVYEESPGICIILGYLDVPIEEKMKYDYSCVRYMEHVYFETATMLVGNGNDEIAYMMEQYRDNLRIYVVPCPKHLKNLKLLYYRMMFRKRPIGEKKRNTGD